MTHLLLAAALGGRRPEALLHASRRGGRTGASGLPRTYTISYTFGLPIRKSRIDIQNSWMAVPSLAPIAAVFGLETAAAVAARFAPKVIPRGPLVFPKRDLRGGDFWANRIGREAHNLYKEMARAKNGWTPEPRVRDPDGKLLQPDLGTPPRTPDPKARNYIEVKPNTPSGRAAAARQIKKYEEATGRKVRALFYDPKRFM